MATDGEIVQLKSRAWEADLIDWRGYRIISNRDWQRRLKIVDGIARGDWPESQSDESIRREPPAVMNLVQVSMGDKAKLASESVPVIVCYPEKETQPMEEAAHLREAAFDTHWEMNGGDLMIPQLSMDLDGAGAVFVAVYVDKDESDYPVYHRIDPRFCYPDVINGKLMDLLTLEEMNYRAAAQMFPNLGLDQDPLIKQKTVELIHYYSKKKCIQAVMIHSAGVKNAGASTKCYITQEYDPKGVLPVAFAKLDTFDGQFRGNYDQVIGSLLTKDRIVKQVLDYTDELVYTPKEALGVLNPEAIDGPGTIYHLDPMVPGAHISRVPPATGAMLGIQLAQFLTEEQRGGTSYPAARQGEVSQSIASASFVASTMGSLTSDVRNIQRLIGKVREKLNQISAHYDEKFLDFEKPLVRPISKKTTYTPTKVFGGNYKSRCIYGASAGLDRMSADTRVIQHVTAGLVSHETGREQIDYVRDPNAEETKIELEQSTNIFAQKLLGEADLPMMMQLLTLQQTGLTLSEAAAQVFAQQQAAASQAPAAPGAPQAPGEQPGPAPEPTTAAQDQQGLQAGAPAPAPQFATQPVENVMVGRQPAGTVTKI